ncbi:hypothetical protein J5N97_009794 [Dioscorea zingiberensis]|uniref:Uncharacterized protein n=1 Tax=Dioscorea zingiberensis TaxID=325984 RepID=A0A9D5CYW2_9LILI|nr:hypothetical protein J5N97_009794 [Dioscorea zingiberensis]
MSHPASISPSVIILALIVPFDSYDDMMPGLSSTIQINNPITGTILSSEASRRGGAFRFRCSSSQPNLNVSPSPPPPPPPLSSEVLPSRVGFQRMESGGGYGRELDLAVKVVQMACSLCQRVQEGLVGRKGDQIQSKDDNSPVTVADWGVQATVSWILSEFFGSENVSIVAEEDIQALSKDDAAGLLESVVSAVNGCLIEAPRYGLNGPQRTLGTSEVLDAIRRCNSNGGPEGRYWVLDPVDGTLGFVL